MSVTLQSEPYPLPIDGELDLNHTALLIRDTQTKFSRQDACLHPSAVTSLNERGQPPVWREEDASFVGANQGVLAPD